MPETVRIVPRFCGERCCEDFERDKEALLEYHARLVPEDLAPEQRRTLYRMMRLKVAVRDGVLTTADWDCNDELTLPGSSPSTTNTFRFRAVLTGQDAELELSRI
jgi:hypothetical protein